MILNDLKPKHTATLKEAFIIYGPDGESATEFGPETIIRGTFIAPSQGSILIYTSVNLKQFDRVYNIKDSNGKEIIPASRWYEVFSSRPALDAMGRVYAYSQTLIPFGDLTAK